MHTPSIALIDDEPSTRGFVAKLLPNCPITQFFSIPDNLIELAPFDIIICDGDGISNPIYPNGIAFLLDYANDHRFLSQSSRQTLIFHSGANPSHLDKMELLEAGVRICRKGDSPKKLVDAALPPTTTPPTT